MKWRRWVAGVVVMGAIGVGAYVLTPVRGAPRNLALTPDAAHGAYLMTVGGCVACHTDSKAGGAELAGGEAIRTMFGTFYPPNITPDKTSGIGGWTLAQFSDAMSNGEGPNGPLYPVFPYTRYTLMSDQDIVDVFAALQQVPAVASKAPDNDVPFPFNMRMLMTGWQHLFFRPGRFQPDPNRSEAWNRGAFLATGPGHCIECHTPRNILGAADDAMAFQGSPGGPSGKAPAITSTSLKADGFDHAALVDTLKTGFTPDNDVLGGPMGPVIADSTSKWTDADLNAIATFLLGEN